MTGGTPVITEIFPEMGLKFIYFTCTLDSSALADFSQFSAVHYVDAVDDSSPFASDEAVVAITDGGDVEFTNNSNAIRGFAIVQD